MPRQTTGEMWGKEGNVTALEVTRYTRTIPHFMLMLCRVVACQGKQLEKCETGIDRKGNGEDSEYKSNKRSILIKTQ